MFFRGYKWSGWDAKEAGNIKRLGGEAGRRESPWRRTFAAVKGAVKHVLWRVW
jgi:hypothetical protein